MVKTFPTYIGNNEVGKVCVTLVPISVSLALGPVVGKHPLLLYFHLSLEQQVITLTKPQQVKPISAADQRTLDSAIAMANELASKSMSELDCNQESPPDSEGMPDSPVTPSSPTKHPGGSRFSFK